MSDTTAIGWTEATWNPWRGCTRISPGCDHCYMFTAQERYGLDPAIVTRTKTWGDPLKWQRAAERDGTRRMVFTCSWSDWFHRDADPWRDEAWDVIRRTPNLVYQILTKRPGLIAARLPADWGEGYPNVWLGVSIESADYAWRADVLRQIPAAVRFISAEPLLGPLDKLDLGGVDWLIIGGESGHGRRDMALDWLTGLVNAARAVGTAVFVKQDSALRPGEWGRIPERYRVREFPA